MDYLARQPPPAGDAPTRGEEEIDAADVLHVARSPATQSGDATMAATVGTMGERATAQGLSQNGYGIIVRRVRSRCSTNSRMHTRAAE